MLKVTNGTIGEEYGKHPDTVRKRVKKMGGLTLENLRQILNYYHKKSVK